MPYDFPRLAHGEGSEGASVQQAAARCRGMQELAVNSETANAFTWDSMEITPISLLCFLISVHSCFIEVTLNN